LHVSIIPSVNIGNPHLMQVKDSGIGGEMEKIPFFMGLDEF